MGLSDVNFLSSKIDSEFIDYVKTSLNPYRNFRKHCYLENKGEGFSFSNDASNFIDFIIASSSSYSDFILFIFDFATHTDIISSTNSFLLEQKLLVTAAGSENPKLPEKGKDRVDEIGGVRNKNASITKKMARLARHGVKSYLGHHFFYWKFWRQYGITFHEACAEETVIDVYDFVKRTKIFDSDSTLDQRLWLLTITTRTISIVC